MAAPIRLRDGLVLPMLLAASESRVPIRGPPLPVSISRSLVAWCRMPFGSPSRTGCSSERFFPFLAGASLADCGAWGGPVSEEGFTRSASGGNMSELRVCVHVELSLRAIGEEAEAGAP